MPQAGFDPLVDLYDALVDWPRRLAGEEPFYRAILEGGDEREQRSPSLTSGRGAEAVARTSLLDVACGTGRHAAMFHRWGCRVEGADISPAMIERCRRSFGESPDLRWAVRSFAEPHPEPESFDAVICVGNSLALARDPATAQEALRSMFLAARPGGAVVVQVLNLWRFPEGPVLWQKPRRVAVGSPAGRGAHILIKGVHRHATTGYVELIAVPLAEPASEPRLHTQSFLGLRAELLVAWAREAGARDVQLLGSIAREAYVPEVSQDLILVARR